MGTRTTGVTTIALLHFVVELKSRFSRNEAHFVCEIA